MPDTFRELRQMTKSKKRPQDGDVFVIQPEEHTYYFGKVIIGNIQSKNIDYQGMVLVYIYEGSSTTKEIPSRLSERELLLPPKVVNQQGWSKGYFETVGNIAVTEQEKNIDFGFFSSNEPFSSYHEIPEQLKVYYDVYGEVLLNVPKHVSFNGLVSYGYIGREIRKITQERDMGRHS